MNQRSSALRTEVKDADLKVRINNTKVEIRVSDRHILMGNSRSVCGPNQTEAFIS